MAQFFDRGTLLDAEIQEIAQGHKASLEGYLFDRLTRDPDFPTLKRSGKYNKRRQTYGRGADEASDDTVVAPGSETPKGSEDLDEGSYRCTYRKKAKGTNNLYGMELERGMNLWEEWSLDCAHDVMISRERELVSVLKGNGDNDNDNDQLVDTKTLGSGGGVSADGILISLEEIVRAGPYTRCVLGQDVALAMSRNGKVIGAAGASQTDQSKVSFGAIQSFLREHFGITETIIGMQDAHDGDRRFKLKYEKVHDGIMYFDTGDNLVAHEFVPFMYDEFEDEDREMRYVRAKIDTALTVMYAENSLAVTNPFQA